MNPLASALMTAQSLIALSVLLYAVRCFINDTDDIVSRYVLRAGTAAYMLTFFSACMIGLLP